MSPRARFWECLLLACMCVGALCQRARAEIPDALRNTTIVELRVAGESELTSPPDETKIMLGDKLTRALLRDAIKRILATGRFVDVQVDAEAVVGGARVVFKLQPKITLRRVSISGNQNLDTEAIEEVLGVGTGSDVEADELETIAANVRKLYAEHGYVGARADASFRDTDDPSIKVLMVQIDEAAPTRIVGINFIGERPLDPAAVLATMEVSIGDVLDRRKLTQSADKGQHLLRTHGFFEASIGTPLLTIAGEDATVDFPTHIGPRYTLQVLGAGPLLPRELVDVLTLSEEPLTPASLETLPARIRDLYAKHGFLDAHAEIETRRGPKRGQAQMIIRADAGKQIEIVDVNFSGVTRFPQEFLRDQLQSYLEEDLPGSDLIDTVDSEVANDVVSGDDGRPREVRRPMDEQPTRTYYEPTYKEAIKHITEVYQADGYLDVKVGEPYLDRVGATRATVTIAVTEGPRTMVHGVVLNGQRLISDRDLLLASTLVKNQPFSYLLLEEARLRMLDAYHERGYMFAKIEPSVRFSRDRARAEVAFQIIESYPVYIGDIQVRGADRTSPKFIEGLLELKRGDLFRPSKARESEATLHSLGVFTGVSVDMLDPELPARVKTLVVTISERKNQFLDFSAGLSTGQGVRAGFEYGYRNLFDRAVGLTLRVNFAHQLFFVQDDLRERFQALPLEKRLERNISLGAVIPRLPGLGSTRTNIDLVHVRDNERDFGLDKNGITLAFTETPWQRVTLMEAADLENNGVDLFNGDALDDYLANTNDQRLRRLLRVPEGNTTLVALRTSVSYDQRDSPFVPTHGYFASASSELASTLTSGTVDTVTGKPFMSRFLKMQVTGSGYAPLGRKMVLAGQIRIGRIVHLTTDSETYPNRAFFLGGVDTMRGYFQDELMPQDIADKILSDPKLNPNSIVRSGDAFLLIKGELRFPIYGQLGGGLFADIGNLWADAANFNPFELRPTAGAGLRLATPVGPVAVDYGIVLKRRRGLAEPFGTLHFSIGLF